MNSTASRIDPFEVSRRLFNLENGEWRKTKIKVRLSMINASELVCSEVFLFP